ncbi:AMMECR1 domain-containing protein [Podospora fimiseda]|uniref:AMMECR1 domain-containing protein n=1 Tax=Podospora fimiseda TaxID=252190 RepID=A0AAN7BYG6_9PEZI|nr:AMMECR1 domain-containing protein [Podospora fimiseda]
MATPAHCLYCFEVLSANLEHRKPLTLSQVQKSYSEYLSSSPPSDTKQLPALRRLADTSSSSSSSSSSSLSLASSTPATSLSSTPSLPSSDDDTLIPDSPLFVTWNTLHPRHGHVLRGCIGTFEPHPIEEGLSSYALISALQDMRFNPITLKELPTLSVAVTLLTDFEDASDAMDWELGKHGIRISFYYHGKKYGSTYLPDVAVEQGWDKEETITSLMRKAGWMGKKDKWTEVELKVVRYQGRKEKLEYEEYKRWREWVDGKKE